MKKHFALASVLLTLGVATASAQAHDAAPQSKQSQSSKAPKDDSKKSAQSPLNTADRQFMLQVAQDGMGEVEMGKLGASKASNADVKKFGQRMVDDHTKANDELKRLADKKNLPLPTELSNAQKTMNDHMAKMPADQFDRPFMTHMVSDHKKAISLFQKEEKIAKDADLKQWVTNTLPTLEDHLKQAQTIEGELRQPPQKTSQR